MSILNFLPIVGKVLDKILPDKLAREAAQLELLKLAQTGELALLDADLKMAQGQMETNKAEASNPSLFVSGWRPFVGWILATGMGSQFVLGPFVQWASTLAGYPTVWPQLDLMPMLTMLGGMLGLGGMRTAEKIKGVARD